MARAPAVLFTSGRARELLWRSWAALLLLAAAILADLASFLDWLPGTDDPLVLLALLAAAFVLVGWTQWARAREVSRIWRAPEGLVFETLGLLGPRRVVVPRESWGALRVAAPDRAGSLGLQLPGGRRLVAHTGPAGLDLGLPSPPAAGRR